MQMIGNNTKPYLLNRKCEGKASNKDLMAFRLPQLKKISTDLGISHIGRKDELCERIRDYISKNPSVVSTLMVPVHNKTLTIKGKPVIKEKIVIKKKPVIKEKIVIKKKPVIKEKTLIQVSKMEKYQTLEEMLEAYNIDNIRSLIELNDEELQALINIVKLHDGKIDMTDLLKDVKNENEKITIFINELAGKLCRCIEKIGKRDSTGKLEEHQIIPICINSIFHKKGITIAGFQCEPKPMLIPNAGSSYVVKKLPHKSI